MEMKQENETKECHECGRQAAEPGRGDCRLCHLVLLGRCAVAGAWKQEEYDDLCGLLRESGTLARFIAESRDRGAYVCVGTGTVLARLARRHTGPEAEYLRALCGLLHKDALEISALAKIPGGLDAWMQRCSVMWGEVVAACYRVQGVVKGRRAA
jgi:hypothetical protein